MRVLQGSALSTVYDLLVGKTKPAYMIIWKHNDDSVTVVQSEMSTAFLLSHKNASGGVE